MFERGINEMRWEMMSDWSCLVACGVRRCLLFVCLASFVRVFMMTVSLFLNVVCLIFCSVCKSVKVM